MNCFGSHADASDAVSRLQQLLSSANVPLKYSIAQASSWSGTYHPSNILHNRPHEMYSRWSGSSQHAVNSATSASSSSTGTGMALDPSSYLTSASSSSGNNLNLTLATSSSNGSSPSSSSAPSSRRMATVPVAATPAHPQKQYIILKLDKLSVVRSITFGKYHKPHPCNLRDFKVYGSTTIDSLLPSSSLNGRPPASKRLLRGGLKNDALSETFELRWLEDAATGSASDSSIESATFLPAHGAPDRRSATHALVNTGNAVPFAIRYIKIVPLAAHTPNYNFSIWHVALAGVSDAPIVSRVARSYQQHRQSTATRLILKHLRQFGHHTAFQALLHSSRLAPPSQTDPTISPSQTNLLPYSPHRPFEHPLLTTLFDALVRRASWDEVELCLNRAAYGDLVHPANSGSSTPMSPGAIANLSRSAIWTQPWQKSMFSAYISRQIPKASWSQIHPSLPATHLSHTSDVASQGFAPSGRGGHAIVFDSEKGIAYLFGGWDGQRDLSDFWAYHVNENRWRLISADTQLQGGPSPRSCHKMCLDEKRGCIYLLGRYIDYESTQQSEPINSDSLGYGTRNVATASPSSALPVSPSLSTARTTRANFLASYPESFARDIQMIFADNSLQTDDIGMEGASVGGQSRSARPSDSPATAGGNGSNSAGSTPAPASNFESSPLLTGNSGNADLIGRSSGASSRLQSSIRTDSQQRQPSLASPVGREADFFRFSTCSEKWERLSADTYADGGPKLIFDHGLVIDAQNQMMYVFGGRVTDPDPAKFEFSGMWRYDIIQRSWTFLFDDRTSNGAKILSRSGHSMLLDSGRPGASGISPSHTRQIWILGGQRGASATFLADMYTYNLATGTVREVSRNTAHNGPEAAFTQRATIDVAAREISVFIGLIGGRNERKRSAFWIYSIPRSSWRKVYQYEGGNQSEFASEAVSVGSGGAGAPGLGLGAEDGMLGTGDNIDVDGEMEGDDVPESGPLQVLPTYSDEMSADDEEMPIEPPANSWTPYAGQNMFESVSTGNAVAGDSASNPGSSPLSPTPTRAKPASGSGAGNGAQPTEPQPRYAAQLVFDDRKKVYYLHGGNPEDASDRSYRLDDFWRLTLLRPTPGEILRRAKFRVRRQRFLEMTRNLAPGMNESDEDIANSAGVSSPAAMGSPSAAGAGDGGPRLGLEALMYLQTEVGAVVDHSDESESRLFRRLMPHLLNAEMGRGPLQPQMGMGEYTSDDPLLQSHNNSHNNSNDRVIGGGIGSSPLNPYTSHPHSTETWTAAGGKRTREEAETDEAEMASSVSSLVSADDGGSDMLSASQVLQHRQKKQVGAAAAANSLPTLHVGEDEGRPSALYVERTRLFRELIEYFNPELLEPRAELGGCIEVALGG